MKRHWRTILKVIDMMERNGFVNSWIGDKQVYTRTNTTLHIMRNPHVFSYTNGDKPIINQLIKRGL